MEKDKDTKSDYRLKEICSVCGGEIMHYNMLGTQCQKCLAIQPDSYFIKIYKNNENNKNNN